MGRRKQYDTSFLVRLSSTEKAELEAQAASLDLPLTEVFREGARHYLAQAKADAPPVYRTRSGRVLTDVDIEALADEAERGYDADLLLEARELARKIDSALRR